MASCRHKTHKGQTNYVVFSATNASMYFHLKALLLRLLTNKSYKKQMFFIST